jgi:hypothetical protein
MVYSITSAAQANQDAETPTRTRGSFGLGAGLDYGGLGLKTEVNLLKNLGVFGGLGYNLESVGYNVGLQAKLNSQTNVVPVFAAMYGYNAVIFIIDNEGLTETYYGFSLGGGVDFKLPRNPNHFFSIKMLIPARSQAFKDDFNAIRNSRLVEISEPWPVNFSFGYHFRF